MSDDHCDHCPVAGWPCLLRRRGQCGHAAREAEVRRLRPGAETPYTDRAIAHATRENPFATDTGDRLRVAFLGPALSSHGGTETWHRTLIPRLDERIAIIGYGVTDPHQADPGVVAALREHCPVPIGMEDCRWLARSCDVLVYWGVPNLGPYLPPRDTAGRPRVIGVSHGDGNSPWTHWVFRETDRDVDRYVAVSASAKGPIPEARRADADVILNAVEPDRLVPGRSRDEVRAELAIPEGERLVLYCGRMSEEKRADVPVAAMASVEGAVLAVAGSGHLRHDVERAASGHAARVRFLGVRADVADLMNAADLLVSPSDCEGFGLTMAEAMWIGCPVLATPVGFLEDHPRMAARVPREADSAAWAAAIDHELRWRGPARSRAAWAREEARRLFAPERFAAEWSDLLLKDYTPVERPAPQRTSLSPRKAYALAHEARDCVHRSPCGCATIDCAIHGRVPSSQCLDCADRSPVSPPRPAGASAST
jgi:glycosyltransferase involved in cell wall biosynthesis